jgi:hypothetical protein
MGVTTARTIKFPIRTLPGAGSSTSIVVIQQTSKAQIKTGMVSVPTANKMALLLVNMRQKAVIAPEIRKTPAMMPMRTKANVGIQS